MFQFSGKITTVKLKKRNKAEVRYTYEVKMKQNLKAKNVENYVESPAGFELVKIETLIKEIPFSRDSRKYKIWNGRYRSR